MSRPSMITRTIKGTKVTALVVNIPEQKVEQNTYTLARTYSNEKQTILALEKLIANPDYKVSAILSSETTETLYGMDEQKFIENAQILPPRKA